MMKLNKDTFEVEFVDTLTCFCGGGGDNDSGGGDVSDEDLDEDLQQDIAAAAVEQSGGDIGNYSYSPSFSNEDAGNETLINATADILAAAASAPPGQMQQAVDTGTSFAAQRPGISDALVNAAMAGLPPSQPVDISVGSTNIPPAVITGPNGEVIDTTTGNIISGDASYFGDLGGSDDPPFVNRYTGMNTDPLGQQYSTLLGNVNNALTNQDRFVNRRFRNAVNSGAIIDPNFDAAGQLDGFAANTGPFGSMVYTGMNNPNAPPDTSGNDIVPPQTNPLTGTSQCPDGYVFDDDLQACRRKTKRELRGDGNSSTASGDMYYRRTSLDDAPANLPGGFNFADANRAFTQSYAFRPSFYRNPMDTTGFTKLL